jgi:phospholipid/cholesterol/gamma-HCH transport system substrate-binding protein
LVAEKFSMQVFRSEIKVGLLVLISFILFVVGIFVVSDIRSLWDKKKTITILFHYADGITKGSPVWYAGYEAGGVSDIRIANGTADRIAITVRVIPEARVRKDSRCEIRSLGMMGAKYIEITPGSPDSPELASGDTMEGNSPASLSEILETGQKVASNLLDLVQEAKNLVHEVRTEYTVKETVVNANSLLVHLRDQTAELGPIMKNLKQVTGDGGKELVALLKEVRDTNKGLQKRLQTVETSLTKTLGKAGDGISEVQGTFHDVRSVVASSQDDIASLLLHLNETARNLEGLTEDLRAHPWKVVWKADGTPEIVPAGAEQWREKGRIGPYGKK